MDDSFKGLTSPQFTGITEKLHGESQQPKNTNPQRDFLPQIRFNQFVLRSQAKQSNQKYTNRNEESMNDHHLLINETKSC